MATGEPEVRPALLSDADAVFSLLRKFATSYEPVRTDFDASYPKLLEEWEGADLLVAECDGLTVG